ncbi:MAG: hypothetical protein U5R06_07525 [candidate division KSB1 bacterium]|nr:hypothetical protein [candidate division KSB1 bacterium]
MIYGPMQYEALMLTGVESMHPQTAQNIIQFVQTGGTLVMVDSLPNRSPVYIKHY